MSYSGINFLGATVTSIDMSLSQSDAAQIQLRLVENLNGGDSFTSGTIGHPYSVAVGDITIRGLLQSQLRESSTQGSPVYTVRLVSPAALLDGASVILSDYRDSISGIPNLFNVFGYYEDKFGYGGSYANDLGMVWEAENFDVTYSSSGYETGRTSNGMFGIKPGIEDLQVGTNQNFGNAISYRDNTYTLDLSELSGVDQYWRFGGANGSATVREIIDGVCGDFGFDWFPELTSINGSGPHTIKIRTIDRKTPRLDNQIAAYAASKSGYVSLQTGQESNYDQTNLFMVGANIEELWQQGTTGAIQPFWGFDLNGVVIEGTGVDDAYTVTVNAQEISDILTSVYGTPTFFYELSVAELRCALANQDVWCAFMLIYKNAFALAINACSASAPYDETTLAEGYRFSHDFITQSPYFANIVSNVNFYPQFFTYMNRVYQFVLSYAQQWFGRRWIVKTPNLISLKIEPDTGRILYDWEPIESAFAENGSQPLGLSVVYEEIFQDGNYRWMPFVRFADADLIDPTTLHHQNLVVYNNKIYVPCRIMQDAGIFYVGGESCVAIELDNPAYYYPTDFLGGVETIKDLFALINLDWTTYRNDTPLKYGPMVATPEAVAIPMRSNTTSYGPWSTNGIPGATLYRKEEGLAPWNYGGYHYMNLAASGYLADFVRQSQVEENGSITYEGLPDKSIGDEITSGGSIVTDVNIRFSTAGVTTTYQLKSHTQRPGAFGKIRSERLARLGQNQLRFGKNLIASSRHSFNQVNRNQAGQTVGSNGRFAWNDRISRMVRQETPYGCLVAHVATLSGAAQAKLNLVSTQTYAESVQNVSYTGIFYNSACVSWDAILRPFSVDTSYSGLMPNYETHATNFPSSMVTKNTLTMWQEGNNIDWYLFGDSYSGIHARKSNSDPTKARPLGLRTPQDVVGYGYDIWGKPVPNATTSGTLPQNLSNSFISGYGVKSELHKAAPLDLRYDPIRAVWGVPGVLQGIIDRNIAPGASGFLALYYNNKVQPYRVPIKNKWARTTLLSGYMAVAQFDYFENMNVVTNSECLTSNISIPIVSGIY